jgi:hypothetical protein
VKIVFLLLFYFSALTVVIGQEKETVFGFSFKPVISGSLINEGLAERNEAGLRVQIPKLFGYSAGMNIRHSFTKRFSIESGIHFVQRNYSFDIDDRNYNIFTQRSFRVVGYQVPVLALIYVQLTRQIFMDVSFGITADLYPSDVAILDDDLLAEMRRRNWVSPALEANLGWEWRSKNAGTIYLGATYHRPFGDIYYVVFEYDGDVNDPLNQEILSDMYFDGNYLTLDFRYFFKPVRKKAVN